MTKPLGFALCADDYAMTAGISAGIREALDAGGLSATSVMTTSRWWPDAAGPLKAYTSKADIGLHINLTLGTPLTSMPKLAPQGRLPELKTLLRLHQSGNLPLEEIGAEIDRQCQQFSDVFGRPPDHVDGHQHVHALSAIRPLVFDALERRAWQPWLRDSSDRLWRLPWRRGVKKALALAFVAKGFAADARRCGFKTNDGFAGFSDFDPSRPYGLQFESYLRMSGPRHLIMCHPGHVDEELRRIDPVVETRELELRYLTTGIFPFLDRNNVMVKRLFGDVRS